MIYSTPTPNAIAEGRKIVLIVCWCPITIAGVNIYTMCLKTSPSRIRPYTCEIRKYPNLDKIVHHQPVLSHGLEYGFLIEKTYIVVYALLLVFKMCRLWLDRGGRLSKKKESKEKYIWI